MKDHERVVVTGVLSVLLLGWLGFLLHQSPRFAGSAIGSVFGISAAVLMMVTLIYPLAKRVPYVHKLLTPHISMNTLLTVHIYAGIFGPLLAIVHTGHKYDSWMGIILTAVMLLVVVSGFTVRYLLPYVSHEIKDKLILLQTARGDLDSAWGVLDKSPAGENVLPKSHLLAAGLGSLGIEVSTFGPAGEVVRIAEGVADLEYAVGTHDLLKRRFSRFLKVHIVLSVILFMLLALHIGSGIYFGLRWLQ